MTRGFEIYAAQPGKYSARKLLWRVAPSRRVVVANSRGAHDR